MADDPRPELAEHYYAVARDLERNAKEQLAIASQLYRYADQICEQSIKEAPSSPTSEAHAGEGK